VTSIWVNVKRKIINNPSFRSVVLFQSVVQICAFLTRLT